MSIITSRSLLSPNLLESLVAETECSNLKFTLSHINHLMSKTYSPEDVNHQRELLACPINSDKIYSRYIRDAQNQQENLTHLHTDEPICEDVPPSQHRAHEDFPIVMREDDLVAPSQAADKVFDFIGKVRSFFEEQLGIKKMFGCDADINAVIHYGRNYGNAFWDSQAIYFGDGDGRVMGPFYNDIDIIAHELAHGYISSTADFMYFKQPGALNESFADVLGIMVKQFVKKENVYQSNWLLGENLFLDKKRAPALRSFIKPGSAYYFHAKNYDPQVGHMSQYTELDMRYDNGGVHIFSGIPNRAFYLLATELGGNSWDIAGKIWIAAITDPRITNKAQFSDFANATVRAARNLHGEDIALKTFNSWVQVGVDVKLN